MRHVTSIRPRPYCPVGPRHTLHRALRTGHRQGPGRIFVVWERAVTPLGVIINLDSPGADPLGGSGFPGKVNIISGNASARRCSSPYLKMPATTLSPRARRETTTTTERTPRNRRGITLPLC
ncbi:TrbI/VirB10 family protein [Xanthomonas campestris]|uniref:TrbI/VirB10 family protein n=1 Tax=Xanthomonas campestris TaxID=339 RepID=UPI003CCF1177